MSEGLLCVEPRDAMDRLDAAVGVSGWQDAYSRGPVDRLECSLSIRRDGMWDSKFGVVQHPINVINAYGLAFRRAVAAWGFIPAVAEYRPVPGFDGYLVGDDGSVLSCWERGRWHRTTGTWRQMKTPPDDHGYFQVNLYRFGERVHCKVHLLVLLAFVGPPPDGLICRHLNGNQTDNRLTNLAYGTYAENSADTVRHGRTNRGQRCHAAKITSEVAISIRQRVAAGELQKHLAAELGLSTSTVCDVVNYRTWAYLTESDNG